MKPTRTLLLAAWLLATVTATVGANGDHQAEGWLKFRPTFVEVDGDKTRVAEYELGDQGTTGPNWRQLFDAHLALITRSLYLELESAHSGHAAEQRHRVYLEAYRALKAEFSINRFQHRLDHDPLDNLDASQAPVTVYGENLSPGHEYRVVYDDIRGRAELNLPQASWLRLTAAFRREHRQGGRQTLIVNKCASCHVVSTPRRVDEVSDTFSAGVHVQKGGFAASYTFQHSEFEERTRFLTYRYDRAIHPGTAQDVFTSRALYDYRDGPLPVDLVPPTTKRLHTLKVKYDISPEAALAGAAVWSEVENRHTGLTATNRHYSGRFVASLRHGMTITARFRHSTIDSDPVFVDLPERANVAGPHAGQTYTETYPAFGPVDFTRLSALSREINQLDLDFRAPMGSTRFSLQYNLRQTDRDHFEIERTREQRLTASVRTDPRRPLSGFARYRVQWVTDPLTHHKAAVERILQPYPSPGLVPFFGLQYFTMFESRQADLTNQPTHSGDAFAQVNWKPGANFGVSVNGNFRNQKNTELNYGNWSQQLHAIGATGWYAPTETVTMNAGLQYNRHRTETLYTIPVYNG